MPQVPKDPVMLLSFINTRLRDYDSSLEELCASLGISQTQLTEKLQAIGYKYQKETNQFQ